MLFSFDIDGTLINPKDKMCEANTVNQQVAYAIALSLIKGDTVIINTGHRSVEKIKWVCFDIIKQVYYVDENGKSLFLEKDRQKFFDAINNNLYASNFCGACLRKVRVNNFTEIALKYSDINDLKTKAINLEEPIMQNYVPVNVIENFKKVMQNNDYFRGYNGQYSLRTHNSQENRTLEDEIKSGLYYYFRKGDKIEMPEDLVLDEIQEKEIKLKQILKENNLPLSVNCMWDNGFVVVSDKSTKTAPIKFLSKKLGYDKNQVIHFGDDINDIIDKNVGRSFIINNSNYKKQQEKNKVSTDNVTYFDDLISAVTCAHLEQIITQKEM